jgi:hypothetical protein
MSRRRRIQNAEPRWLRELIARLDARTPKPKTDHWVQDVIVGLGNGTPSANEKARRRRRACAHS